MFEGGRDGLAYGPDHRRRLMKRGILLATAGLLLTLAVGLGLGILGLMRLSYRQWAFALALTVVVQGALWLVPRLGWDARLTFDPHYLYLPMLAAAVLLNTYVYVMPEARSLILIMWFVALLFMVGRAGFQEVALLGAAMTIGYLMVLHLLSSRDPALSLPFEWLSAVLFLAMRQHLRGTDTLGRYGGDELAVIMPATPKDEALSTVERLRAVVEGHRFRDGHQPSGRLTISAGIGSCPEDGGDYEALLRRADESLYRAKQLGRNRVQAA